MQPTFATVQIRKYHDLPAQTLADYGSAVAKALAVRFADLHAAQNAAELMILGAEEREFENLRALALPVATSHFLILVPSHPKRKGESLEWVDVTRVKVVAIERRG